MRQMEELTVTGVINVGGEFTIIVGVDVEVDVLPKSVLIHNDLRREWLTSSAARFSTETETDPPSTA